MLAVARAGRQHKLDYRSRKESRRTLEAGDSEGRIAASLETAGAPIHDAGRQLSSNLDRDHSFTQNKVHTELEAS
jgi:hypothetical protein